MVAATDMAPALAHALELPEKRRSGEDQYRIVQPIYYRASRSEASSARRMGVLGTLILALRTLEGADLCRLSIRSTEQRKHAPPAILARRELSHVARAMLAMLSRILLVTAVAR
jgi:hypothetical protein